jgi:Cu+-exporting ATPase
MFDLFKSKPKGEQQTFKISGMHCTSCAMSIDGELEDLPGVISADTKYAQAQTKVEYDPAKVAPDQMKQAIAKLGYQAK